MSATNGSGSNGGQRGAEQIVLPGTSFVPLACALGLMILFVGLANWWVILFVGAAILLVAAARWISQIS